jgi:ABC-type multidrug transport system permease subunit
MRAIPLLVLSNFQLSYRVRITFFFNFAFPMMISFAYFQIFAHGNPLAVARMMGPLITLTMMTHALLVAGMRSAGMRERDMFRQYHLTPVRSIHLVLSDIIVGYLIFLPVMLVEVGIGVYFYHAPFRGSLLEICALCSLGYFALAALGLLLSSIFNTAQEAAVVTQLLFFVLMFLSGTTMPLDGLPGALQHVAIFTPPALIIVAIQGIILQGHGLAQILPVLLALSLSGITAVIVAMLIFRWDKDEKVSRRNRIQASFALVPLVIIGILLNTGARATQWIQDLKGVTTLGPGSNR